MGQAKAVGTTYSAITKKLLPVIYKDGVA